MVFKSVQQDKEDKSTFRERIREKLKGQRDYEKDISKAKFKEFLEHEDSKKYIDERTRDELQEILKQYKKNSTREGIARSMSRMMIEVWRDSKEKRSLSDDETAKNLTKAAEELVSTFSYKPLIKSVNSTARKISRHASASSVAEGIMTITYDPKFFKNYEYPIEDFMNKNDTILAIYRNYRQYKSFFKNLGIELPKNVEMFVNPKDDRSFFHPYVGRIYITPSGSKDQIDSSAVHEITHLMQRLSDVEYQTYLGSDKKKLEELIEKGVEPSFQVIIEAGAKFTETLYYLSKTQKGLDFEIYSRNLEASRVISDLKFCAKYPEADKTSKYKFKEWITKMHRTLNNCDDPNKAFYELVKGDYEKNVENKYLMGMALSSLVFSANKFDIKATMSDLVNIGKSERFLQKLYTQIKNDKSRRILSDILLELD